MESLIEESINEFKDSQKNNSFLRENPNTREIQRRRDTGKLLGELLAARLGLEISPKDEIIEIEGIAFSYQDGLLIAWMRDNNGYLYSSLDILSKLDLGAFLLGAKVSNKFPLKNRRIPLLVIRDDAFTAIDQYPKVLFPLDVVPEPLEERMARLLLGEIKVDI